MKTIITLSILILSCFNNLNSQVLPLLTDSATVDDTHSITTEARRTLWTFDLNNNIISNGFIKYEILSVSVDKDSFVFYVDNLYFKRKFTMIVCPEKNSVVIYDILTNITYQFK